jgi:hypothetical protein
MSLLNLVSGVTGMECSERCSVGSEGNLRIGVGIWTSVKKYSVRLSEGKWEAWEHWVAPDCRMLGKMLQIFEIRLILKVVSSKVGTSRNNHVGKMGQHVIFYFMILTTYKEQILKMVWCMVVEVHSGLTDACLVCLPLAPPTLSRLRSLFLYVRSVRWHNKPNFAKKWLTPPSTFGSMPGLLVEKEGCIRPQGPPWTSFLLFVV